MHLFILFALLLLPTAVLAEEDKIEEAIPVSVKPQASAEAVDIAAVCHKVISAQMGEKDWHAFVLKAQARFKDWSREYDTSDVKRFLDDKLLQLAPSVQSGKGTAVRDFCSWLALYDFFYEPVPKYIDDIGRDDKAWIAEQLSDLDWDRIASRIRERGKGSKGE
ncbi:MAG TPA: hypothetical protein VEK08_11415 [Planctomycetota bacterium]|nr:hypothetical protein [Planctomycetota bacterium]